eukprot:TRINITY_DN4091_c0_g1_i1.p1 TRINITY_DN4091_c0_g1~~TRINITY_DN4091_c0_g1_i1.p1  ORF type:complete len:679 (+),score=192.82 TRINITY_DN4091_c0_g1_i1:104-2038(+)
MAHTPPGNEAETRQSPQEGGPQCPHGLPATPGAQPTGVLGTADRIIVWCVFAAPHQLNRGEAKFEGREAAIALRKGETTVEAVGDAIVKVGMRRADAATALLLHTLDWLAATSYMQLAKQLHNYILDKLHHYFEERHNIRQGGPAEIARLFGHLYARTGAAPRSSLRLLTDNALKDIAEDLMGLRVPKQQSAECVLLDAACAGILLHRCAASIPRNQGIEGVTVLLDRVNDLREAVAGLWPPEQGEEVAEGAVPVQAGPVKREVTLASLDRAIFSLQSLLAQGRAVGPAAEGIRIATVGAACGILCTCVVVADARQQRQHTAKELWALQHAPTVFSPQMDYLGETELTPEEMTGIVLLKTKETAESYLGKECTKAEVTVPAFFSDSQRQAAISGMDLLRIIEEPTAPAVSRMAPSSENNMLIFDLGGATFDVTSLTIDGSVFNRMGDFMGNHIVEIFKRESRDTNQRSLLRLPTERAKRALRSTSLTSMEIDFPMEGIDFYTGGALTEMDPTGRICEKEAKGRAATNEAEDFQRRLLQAEQRAEHGEVRIQQLEQRLETERQERRALERKIDADSKRRQEEQNAQLAQIWSAIRAGPAQQSDTDQPPGAAAASCPDTADTAPEAAAAGHQVWSPFNDAAEGPAR